MTDGREPYADELPDLFSEAIGLADAPREAFLATLRSERPALAARLDELLAADREAGAFLERPFTSPGHSATLAAGDVIEGFRVEGGLASGANGSVYRATQDYPRRTVALKVLHFALPSPGAIARFRLEVRTLARLAHPGIVPLFAAGVLEPEGRALPWFAMELIDGARDIRAWGRERALDARVDAIAEACDAVHHAHLKGVIHRDLKPGNLLVGADGRPRVIDFGVSTSAGSAATLATHLGSLTPEGAVVGTLAYMSPEQFESASDVDARADIYALGVILYELATGSLPYRLGTTPAQAMRAIALDAPLDPVRAAPLERALRGDLAAIILKAIERTPERRYGSAAEFAADLRRWRAGEPVTARRPGVAERTWRAARRRPVLSTAVSLATLGAVAVTATSVAGAAYAYREAMRAQRYIYALIGAFESPEVLGMGRDARVADAADALVREIASAAPPPGEEADGRMVAGRMYEALYLLDESMTQYARALELRSAASGPASAESLEALIALARAQGLAASVDAGFASIESNPPARLALARGVAACEAALGWSDPRTLDAFGNASRALDAEELRRWNARLAPVSIDNDLALGALVASCLALAERHELDPATEDAETVRTAIGALDGLATIRPLDAAALTPTFAASLARAGIREDARALVETVLPTLLDRAIPARFNLHRMRAAKVLADDAPATARTLLELVEETSDLGTVVGVVRCLEALRDRMRLEEDGPSPTAAIATGERALAITSPFLDHGAVRKHRATILATFARLLAGSGSVARAVEIAARARAILPDRESLAPTLRRNYEDDLAAVEALAHDAARDRAP